MYSRNKSHISKKQKFTNYVKTANNKKIKIIFGLSTPKT